LRSHRRFVAAQFNAHVLNSAGLPHNPLINAGASMLPARGLPFQCTHGARACSNYLRVAHPRQLLSLSVLLLPFLLLFPARGFSRLARIPRHARVSRRAHGCSHVAGGQVMVHSLIRPESEMADRFDVIKSFIDKLSGHFAPTGFANSVYLSEAASADRNRSLAYYMRENGFVCYDFIFPSSRICLGVFFFFFDVPCHLLSLSQPA